jgi:glycosyltransferase involved in cell wall biosynthesis
MPRILIISRHIDSASFRQRVAVYFNSLTNAGVEYAVETIPAKTYKTLRLFAKARHFDVVFLHKKRLSPLERFILRRSAKKILYDIDDAVMFDHHNPELPHPKKLKRFYQTVRTADTVIAGNSYLADFAKKVNNNTVIIPTGLDVSEYDIKKNKTDDKTRLVWIGTGSNLLYLKQIKDALEQIGKNYDNVILRIICNEFFDLDSMPVEKIQWSLKSQIPDLVNCDIGLAPLPEDNFTKGKCGFKILQYFAAGLSVVASPVGVNADIVRTGVNGWVAKKPKQWFDNITGLIENSNLRCRMSREAKETAKDYDITITSKKFIDVVLKTIL